MQTKEKATVIRKRNDWELKVELSKDSDYAYERRAHLLVYACVLQRIEPHAFVWELPEKLGKLAYDKGVVRATRLCVRWTYVSYRLHREEQ